MLKCSHLLTGNSTLTSEPSNSRTLHVMAALLLPAAGMCTTVPPVTTAGAGICCWCAWSARFTPRPPPSSSSDGRKRLRERRLNVLRRKPIIFQVKEKAGKVTRRTAESDVWGPYMRSERKWGPADCGDHDHTRAICYDAETCRELPRRTCHAGRPIMGKTSEQANTHTYIYTLSLSPASELLRRFQYFPTA